MEAIRRGGNMRNISARKQEMLQSKAGKDKLGAGTVIFETVRREPARAAGLLTGVVGKRLLQEPVQVGGD